MSYFVFYKVNVHLNDTFIFLSSYLICDVDRPLYPDIYARRQHISAWKMKRSEIEDFDEEIHYNVLSILQNFTLNFTAEWKTKFLSLDLVTVIAVICVGSTFRVFVISRYWTKLR